MWRSGGPMPAPEIEEPADDRKRPKFYDMMSVLLTIRVGMAGEFGFLKLRWARLNQLKR